MRTSKSFLLVLLLSLFLIPACNKLGQEKDLCPIPPPPDRLAEILLDAASSKRDQGAFQKAEDLYEEALGTGFELVEIHYQRACNFALWGKPEKAISSLRESVSLGFCDRELLESNASLDSLREISDFAQILEDCKKQIAAPLFAVPEFIEAKTPTILFLHGWGGSHEELQSELEYWAEAGWVAIAPRAPQSLEDGGYRWALDNTQETKAYLDTVFQHPSLDGVMRDTVFLAGFSQGASYSVRLTLAYPEEFYGAIAICPGAWEPKAEELESLQKKLRPLFLLWGEKDHEKNVQAARLLEESWQKRSWPIRSLSHSGGHSYPQDWNERRSEIAEFLLMNR